MMKLVLMAVKVNEAVGADLSVSQVVEWRVRKSPSAILMRVKR